jgi:phosphoesterase RecJ-like protein
VDFFKWKEMVVIDHHISNTKFWTLNIVDHEASSTCEIIFHIIKKLWYWKYLSKKCINLLLAWIVTDTNIFYNKNTTPDILSTTSKLLEMWWDLNKVIYNFYYKISYEKTKLKWLVFDKLQKNKDSKIVWVKLTKENFKKTKTTENDTTWIINDLLNIDTCEIAFILYEVWDEVKASFRSKTFDIWKFCENFWWWGHKLAAGFKSEKSLDEVEEEVLKKLKKSI